MSFDVEKVSSLAYLHLTEDEKKSFEEQFEQILKHIDQIQEISMTEEEAKAMGAFHVQTAFYKSMGLDPLLSIRKDQEAAPEFEELILNNEEALKNAPKSSGLPNELMYEVPSIIER